MLPSPMTSSELGAGLDRLEYLSAEARPRSELAGELGVSAVTLRVTLHRLRARYRELLVSLVADSLGERAEAGEELRALARALDAQGGRPGESS